MDKDFEKVRNELQKSINDEARKIYSEKVIQHCTNPENVGRMNDPDGSADVRGPCGDSVEIYLNIADRKISDIRFFTDGCTPTVACGSVVTKLAKGRSLKDALKISPADVIDELDGLPEANLHCAILATTSLYRAMGDYLLRKEI